MAKILYLIREPRFIQRDEPLLQLPKKRILYYLFWQVFSITATVGVSQTIAGIGKPPLCLPCPVILSSVLTTITPGFPILIIALIPLRWKVLPYLFTAQELRIMDAPTADNDVVLASLGGKPRISGVDDRDDEDNGDASPETNQSSDDIGGVEEDKWSAAERGVPRDGLRGRGGAFKEA